MNGDVQVGLESALARPEFEREEFRMMFTASDKEQMLSGKTPDRLYEMPNPHTGEKEWCYVTLNPATNRFVTVPRREVPELRFFNGVRLTDAQQENLASGSRVQVEGCTMRNGDITYSGKVGFDALTREYRMTDYRYSKPYIPESLSKQLDERQLAAVKSPEGLDCSKEKARPILGRNGKPLSCIIRLNPRTNGVDYDFTNLRRQEQQASQTKQQEQKQPSKQEPTPEAPSRGRKR